MVARTIVAWAGWILFTFGAAGNDMTIWSAMIGIGLLVQAMVMKLKAS